MKAIILAAGEGKRMRPLTLSRPKPMIEVLGKPLMHHIIESLPSEIKEIILVIGYKRDQIESYFGKTFAGRPITYVHQEEPSGTAMALDLCKGHLEPGERFLFLFADDLHSSPALKKLLKHPMAMLVHEHSDPGRFGVVEVDGFGRVKSFEEKPEIPKSNLVSPGVFMLDTRIFNYPPTRHKSGEYFLTTQIAQLIRDVDIVIEKTDFWHPVGYPDDIEAAEKIILAGNPWPQQKTLVIILAGGRGTRMPESEKHIPKALAEIAGKPILEHQLESLFAKGFKNIRLALGHRANQIIEWLKEHEKFSAVNYVVEQEPLGTGGAIAHAAEGVTEPFLAMNGDVLSDFSFRGMLRASGGGAFGVMAGVEFDDVSGMGTISCDEHKKICTFKEKEASRVSGTINAGLYVLRPKDISKMPKVFSIEYDLFPKLAEEGELVMHEHHGDYWFDCGTEERLARVRDYFRTS